MWTIFDANGMTGRLGPEANSKGEVTPRLYAAGSISNFQEHTYGISGGGNAENMVWGRIAARHGCALEPWDPSRREARLSAPCAR